MPRSPRLEYPGATYHVMARGNRREPIVFGDDDRQLFADTFAEACERTGWQVYAWVLADDHYQAVFRTPNANLVDGMKWLQNSYTRRLNSRHELWGHLFGGRYRSILVEDGEISGKDTRSDYVQAIVDYVHLSPGRLGIVDGKKTSVGDYQWSSLGDYSLAQSKRPKWMAAADGLDMVGLKDTPKGRTGYIERLDEWIADSGDDPVVDGVSVADRVRRGWYWGSQDFKKAMLDRVSDTMGEYSQRGGKNRNYRSSPLGKDHAEQSANTILETAVDHFGFDEMDDMKIPARGDLTRVAIACRVFHETTMSLGWIAEQLNLKSAANVGQQVRKFRAMETKEWPVSIRKWMKLEI